MSKNCWNRPLVAQKFQVILNLAIVFFLVFKVKHDCKRPSFRLRVLNILNIKRVKHDKRLFLCAASFTPFNSIKIHVHHTVTNVFLDQVSTFSSPSCYFTARRCSLGRFDISELQLLLAKPLKKSSCYPAFPVHYNTCACFSPPPSSCSPLPLCFPSVVRCWQALRLAGVGRCLIAVKTFYEGSLEV